MASFYVDLEKFMAQISEPIYMYVPTLSEVDEFGEEIVSYDLIATDAYVAHSANVTNNLNVKTAESDLETYSFYIPSRYYTESLTRGAYLSRGEKRYDITGTSFINTKNASRFIVIGVLNGADDQ